MRVISGNARGRRLQTVKGNRTRPTSDRVKESLFNMLAPSIPGCLFLDLFSGSGAIGIEALSRGAEAVIFVEQQLEAVRVLRANLNHCRFHGEVIQRPVAVALDLLHRQGQTFDIVFMDPPYGQGLVETTLATLEEQNLVKPEGLVVTEFGRKEVIADSLSRLVCQRRKDYGETSLAFYRLTEEV